jgi:hypothetical protein
MKKDDCLEDLSKMTDDLRNGMTFAMSIWTSDNFDWLHHGRCSAGSCGLPDLKLKNFVFNTASGGSGGGGDNGGGGDGGNGGGGDPIQVEDIRAGFAKIREKPHYSASEKSRTLY